MKIRHANAPAPGVPVENTFVVSDDNEVEIGHGDVVEKMCDTLFPSRPHHVIVRATCEEGAVFALYGAATARAMQLIKEQPGVGARIYTELDPKDDQTLDALLSQGYQDDDGLVRMAREIKRGPLTTGLPKGCVVVKDYLLDELECKFFLERHNAMFADDVDAAWLKQIKEKPNFCRFLAVAPNGLAGELLVWTQGETGIVGIVLTPPHFQRKGVGSHLIDHARQYWAKLGCKSAQFDARIKPGGAMRLAYNCGFRPQQLLRKYPGIDV